MSCCGFFVGQSILGAPGERKSIPYSRTPLPEMPPTISNPVFGPF